MDLINKVYLPKRFYNVPTDLKTIKPTFYSLMTIPWNFLLMKCFRGFGKTTFCAQLALKTAIESEVYNDQIIYASKALSQGKRNFGEKLKTLITNGLPKRSYSIKENIGEYGVRTGPGKTRTIYITSYEAKETLRGFHPENLMILDEFGDAPNWVLEEIIVPMLMGNTRLLMTGTVKGKNVFYDMWERAIENPEQIDRLDLHCDIPFLETDQRKERIKALSTEAAWRQEMMNDFEAYGSLNTVFNDMYERFAKERTIPEIVFDPNYPVYSSWDLGHSDMTVVWMFQIKREIPYFIDCYAGNRQFAPDHLKELKKKPYKIYLHFLPSDGRNDVINGPSVIKQMRDFDEKCSLIPVWSHYAGARIGNNVLAKCFFNALACADGINHLRQSKWEVNPRTGIEEQKIVHDYHSHWTTAFITGCVAIESVLRGVEPREILSYRNAVKGLNNKRSGYDRIKNISPGRSGYDTI